MIIYVDNFSSRVHELCGQIIEINPDLTEPEIQGIMAAAVWVATKEAKGYTFNLAYDPDYPEDETVEYCSYLHDAYLFQKNYANLKKAGLLD